MLRRRLRETTERSEFGMDIVGTSAEPILDSEDIGVLAVVLGLLVERSPIEIRMDHGGTWPGWSALAPVPRLLERLTHLSRNGWLSIAAEGNTRLVSHGPTSRRVAAEAGIF